MARRLLLNSRMGLLADGSELAQPLTSDQFSGPGIARQGYSEFNQRELLCRWANDLQTPVLGAPNTLELGSAALGCEDDAVAHA
jgi:hypothetical protein